MNNFGDADASHGTSSARISLVHSLNHLTLKTTGAWEMIDLNHDQTTILLAGVSLRPDTSEMWFKSYGNVPTGNATLMEIPITALSETMNPATAATFTKVYTNTEHVTSKAFRPLPDGKAVALIYGESDGAMLEVFNTNTGTDRTSFWGPTTYGNLNGNEADSIEGTDIVISSDGLYVLLERSRYCSSLCLSERSRYCCSLCLSERSRDCCSTHLYSCAR